MKDSKPLIVDISLSELMGVSGAFAATVASTW